MVRHYDGVVPNYKESLQEAVAKLYKQLDTKPEDAFSVRSLDALKRKHERL